MKPSLQLKLGQQLTMTPQLQQAIRLLQLSTLDLQLEIRQAIESNPMLELDEEEEYGDSEQAAEEPGDGEAPEDTEAASEAGGEDFAEGGAEEDDWLQEGTAEWSSADDDPEVDADWDQTIPEDLPVDSSWDDVYTTAPTSAAATSEEGFDPDARDGGSESLADHLTWQLNLTRLSDRDRLIATAIVDAIDADGMLATPLEEIVEGFDPELEIEPDEVEAMLHLVQQLDPPGIAARDLGECLVLQLRELPADTPNRAAAMEVVGNHMERLGNRDYAGIMRQARVSEEELAAALRLIQSLNPRPGSAITPNATEYVIPDVFVRKASGRWRVELNPEATPRLRINADYASLVRRGDSSSENTYLRNNLQEARWFLKSLQSRNETLLKVATRIVEHQRGFLEYGEEAMKPLVLHDIAEDVGMHESTISRVTTRKYMHTPRGIFELKYFFSSHVGTGSGGEVSSTAIRALIRKLTEEENPKKPLSDSKIAKLLAEQDIQVARRTVAKYRESMSIPPSNERKRLV